MTKRKRGFPKIRCTIGWVRPGGDHAEVKASFMMSMLRAFTAEIGAHGAPLGIIDQQCASGQLVEARNELVAYFLDHADGDWLWIVDTDMTFEADAGIQLIASADPVERPIVGGLCFAVKLDSTDDRLYTNRFIYYPTIYTWHQRTNDDGDVIDEGFTHHNNYARDAMIQCDATGAACLMVHRTVLEKIRAEYGDHWFDRVQLPSGKKFGEDLSFFFKANRLGFPLWVNTGVETAHDKGGVMVDQEWFDDWRRMVDARDA